MNTNYISIKKHIARSPISQERLALALSVSPAYLSRCLNGVRPMPPGMEARIHAALDALEEEKRVAAEAVAKLRAERAAQEARERGLAGTTEGTE